jgi:hypothetical protein
MYELARKHPDLPMLDPHLESSYKAVIKELDRVLA